MFAKEECAAESADNPMFHEVLVAGQLYQMVLKVCALPHGTALPDGTRG